MSNRTFHALYKRYSYFKRSNTLHAFVKRHGTTISSGPFQGTMYLPLSYRNMYSKLVSLSTMEKLLGVYESELHPIFDRILTRRWGKIINIGAAEGYYAVGLSRVQDGMVYAFDTNDCARNACAEMARLNDVGDRLQLGGRCSAEQLDELVDSTTLILIDCEGCEIELLDPERAPSLRMAHILAELHDFKNPTISRTIQGRFESSHHIEIIDAVQHSPEEFHALDFLKSRLLRPVRVSYARLLTYRSTGMQWMFMSPKPDLQ